MELKKELTSEERFILANKVYSDIVRRIIKAVEEKYGAEGRSVIERALYEFGREVGERVRKVLEVEGKGLEDYGKVHYYQDTNFWAIEETLKTEKPGELIVYVSFCPLKDVFTPKDCKIWIPYLKGVVDSVNDRITWKATKVLTRGDGCCELIFTIK